MPEIYPYANLKGQIDKMVSEEGPFPKCQVEDVARFREFMARKGYPLTTTRNYLGRILRTSRALDTPKAWSELTAKELFAALSKGNDFKRLKAQFQPIKNFYEFLEGRRNPPIVAEVRRLVEDAKDVGGRGSRINGENGNNHERVLSTEEVMKVISQARDPCRRALIFFLAESGARAGEAARMLFGDIKIHKENPKKPYADVRIPAGKSGFERHIRIANPACIERLTIWAVNHPNPKDDSPLWIALDGKPLQYAGIKKAVQNCIKATGVSLPHYGPHALRHYCLTQRAKYMSAAALSGLAGWKAGSAMQRVYIHEEQRAGIEAESARWGITSGIEVDAIPTVNLLGAADGNLETIKSLKCQILALEKTVRELGQIVNRGNPVEVNKDGSVVRDDPDEEVE